MGNGDRNSVVKHVVYGLLTRYVRFLPQTYKGLVCLRTEVFGVKQKPENLALRKATVQSSTFNNTVYNVYGVSGKAVDGNPDTNFLKGSCSHTQKDNPSWWRVDLGSDHVDVSEVHIVNRFSQHVVTEGYKITLGDSANVAGNTLCGGLYDFHNFTASAVCFTNPLKTGRYIGILAKNQESLQLCEVEVYSRENLAFQKPTYQHSYAVVGGTSEKAVDGNSNMHFDDGFCAFVANTNIPWWRVDLGQDEFVTEVYLVNLDVQTRLTKFEIRVGTVSNITDISMPSSKCGQAATHYLPQGVGLSFFCRPSLKGRYVTIRDVRGFPYPAGFVVCELEVYSEQRVYGNYDCLLTACHSQAIGVTSSDAIPDGSFSASSKANNDRGPSAGRLNGHNRGWAPKTNTNHTDYLQIDLQYDYVICAVATQGSVNNDQWTTKYKIKLSLGVTFNTYKENNTEKVFNGNSGRYDIVKHGLREYALARFIRFVPTDYHGHKTLRVEVYGVLLSAVPSQAPGNFTVTAILSTSIKVSWASLPEYARHGDITGYKLFYRQKGSVDNLVMESVTGAETLTKDFTNLNKYTKYEFQMLAVGSRGEGPKSSVKVEQTLEDEPSVAPNDVSFSRLNQTTFNISWSPLTRKESYSKVISYEVKISLVLSGSRQKRSPANSKTVNTTKSICYPV
ncbi:unnamed protein product [Pocillopora meandrina]|uniref:Uncharacterized protein n=1 Tax=Pocillopora meandrina TaxID=46732 RepID=A0AAU9Y4A9_9CNID|nr:unnamed protein product [Pocillopora meandrina]